VSARTFTATLAANERGGTTVALPFDAGEAFGRVRAPVRATVNGHTFRTTTMRYGGVDLIGLNRNVRAAAGVDSGDTITVVLEPDEEPREVAVPRELSEALDADPALRSFFDGLSFTHRNEYARWIEGAKRAETRERRLARALELLRAGVRHP
jgi:Bacteriocin-protection, YdeI or OmpD-Associated/Domain of unknown function (DUF1905)